MKVKAVYMALMIVLMGSASCKEKKGDSKIVSDESSPQKTEQIDSNPLTSEQIQDCDDFLEQYEAWVVAYGNFMEKYKDNPVGAVSDPEYSKMLTKAVSWSQDWVNIATSCAVNPSYEKRMGAITEKMETRMKELGFAN